MSLQLSYDFNIIFLQANISLLLHYGCMSNAMKAVKLIWSRTYRKHCPDHQEKMLEQVFSRMERIEKCGCDYYKFLLKQLFKINTCPAMNWMAQLQLVG